MSGGYSYQGTSGDHYHFDLVDMSNYRALPWSGGVLVFAEYTPEPLQIMDTANVYGVGMNLQKTLKELPKMVVYFLPENDATRRALIVRDLVGNFPKMARG
ncbi:MAG TPA: hypothetical protein VGB91_00280 [Rhizomicrobium sp.]